MEASEDRIQSLAPQLNRLRRAAMNLEIPGRKFPKHIETESVSIHFRDLC